MAKSEIAKICDILTNLYNNYRLLYTKINVKLKRN